MQFIYDGKSLPVGKQIAVFTNSPESVGETIRFTDSNGKLLNVARITQVRLSKDIHVNHGRKYLVNGVVEEDASPQEETALATRVYWT